MTLSYPDAVEIVEVGPRDGLQHLDRTIPLADKVRMVELLAATGLRRIEAAVFASPRAIPQMADASELLLALPRVEGVIYEALAPNLKGAQRALDAGADELVGLITTSDTYNKRNANMTVDENLAVLDDVAELAAATATPLTVAIGLGWFCPYEGDVSQERVFAILERIMAAGVRRAYLATSVGMDGPREVHERCAAIARTFPELSLGLHLHNTNGLALANALAAMDAGVRWFEGSVCGLGGGIAMPTRGLDIGNVATEDLVALFAGAGVETGIDLDALLDCSREVAELLGVASRSTAARVPTKDEIVRSAATA